MSRALSDRPPRRARRPDAPRSSAGALAAKDPASCPTPRVARGRVVVDRLGWRPYGRSQPVLDDISLVIEPGSRVLLAGPSGCGKSTLLRALAGLLEVADAGVRTGSVTVDGAPPESRPGLVGMVLQDPGAGVVAASLGRDVAFGPENLGMPRAAIAALVSGSLRQVGLDLPSESPTRALSGGEQQRLALAGALALAPRLLLLDEPTSLLDPGNAAAVRAAVRDVVGEAALTTVVVEHRLGPWLEEGFIDRLVVLGSSGQVLADGEPEDVLRRHGAKLLEAGVWVPGRSAPAMLPVAAEVFGQPAGSPGRPAHGVPWGEVAVATDRVTVVRETHDLNRRPRTSSPVQDLSMTASAGALLALVGPSGSGKSTLMATLAGLLTPSGGEVRAHAALVPRRASPGPSTWRSTDLARAVAWVPQSPGSMVVACTVLEEVMAGPRALQLDEAVHLRRATTLLRALSLDHLAAVDPRSLSGGEQRRLAVAASVVHRPALLLTDELTVGQDRHTWAAVLGVADALRRSGSAVVHATHDDDVVALADDTLRLPPARPSLAPTSERACVAAWCGPLALLAAAAQALPAPQSVSTWRHGVILLTLAVALSFVALLAPRRAGAGPPRGRLRRLGTRLIPGLMAAASVGWSSWLLGGHVVATGATAFLRIAVLVLPSAVLLPFVDTDRLAEQLVQRTRLPARPVVAGSAALQRVQSVGALWAEITAARRVRGLGPARSPYARARFVASVTFTALVGSLAEAARLAVAMDARGFAAAQRRTWLHPASWRRADTIALLIAAVLPLSGWLLGRSH